MGDVFRRKPENFIPDQETAFLKVASGCCAYSAVKIYILLADSILKLMLKFFFST